MRAAKARGSRQTGQGRAGSASGWEGAMQWPGSPQLMVGASRRGGNGWRGRGRWSASWAVVGVGVGVGVAS